MAKVTILGAGNAGHAFAYDISRNGGEVLLFEHPDFAKSLNGIKEKGGIEAVPELSGEAGGAKGFMPGFAKVAKVTTDPKEAMDFSDIIIMCVPAFGQEAIFKLIMPYLRDGMIICLLPGNFASLIFSKILREANVKTKVTFVEASTIPYAVRVVGPGQIYLLAKKTELSIGVFPSKDTNQTAEKLKDVLLLKLELDANVLGAAMNNVNMIIHVPTATLGMGPMESRQGKIQFYAEGASDTVSKVLETMDGERLAVGAAFGLKLPSFLDIVNNFYSLSMKSIRDFTKNSPYHNLVPNDSPKSPKERYISEDCPFGCVPTYFLGKLAGVNVATFEAIIRIDSIYNDTNYFDEGRNLDKLGLGGMQVDEIKSYLESGV
ncbi:MAG: NAD/NADP octopine/nopaline dehydrogenase family protein [Candidatus Margulisiibacteriota bacterium]